MTGRESVLKKLRGIRLAHGEEGNAAARVRQRLDQRPREAPAPAIAESELVDRFTAKAEAAQTAVLRLPSLESVPAAIASELRGRNLGPSVRMGQEPAFASLSWDGLDVSRGAGRLVEPVTVSRAAFGVAETGTLTLLSGPDNPVTLALLGEHHFAVLLRQDLVANFEDVWARMRRDGLDPRTVNFITGPSRSADIEQRLELGAHGPLSLTVLLVEATA